MKKYKVVLHLDHITEAEVEAESEEEACRKAESSFSGTSEEGVKFIMDNSEFLEISDSSAEEIPSFDDATIVAGKCCYYCRHMRGYYCELARHDVYTHDVCPKFEERPY